MKKTMVVVVMAVAAGCAADPGEPGPRDGDAQTIVESNIEYRAETLIMESFPVQLRANVHITNLRSAPVTVTFRDGCLVYLRVYRDAARTSLAYDSERVEGCTDALVPISVGAGQSENSFSTNDFGGRHSRRFAAARHLLFQRGRAAGNASADAARGLSGAREIAKIPGR